MSRTDDLLKKYNLARAGRFYQVFSSDPEKFGKEIAGLVIYLAIFGLMVPYFIHRSGNLLLLEAYMPNLDLIANVVGYSMGPTRAGIFAHLYNINENNLSSLVINYAALLGVTYIIARYTLESGSVSQGWSRAIIMLLATYLVPGSILAYFLSVVGNMVDPYAPVGGPLNWLITAAAGMCFVAALILVEMGLISVVGGPASKVIRAVEKAL
jgi:hypothetical protein